MRLCNHCVTDGASDSGIEDDKASPRKVRDIYTP